MEILLIILADVVECWIVKTQQLNPPLVDHIYTVRLGLVPNSMFHSWRVCISDVALTAITR